jgi:hypothetical protein
VASRHLQLRFSHVKTDYMTVSPTS